MTTLRKMGCHAKFNADSSPFTHQTTMTQTNMPTKTIVSTERIEHSILLVRGEKVMLDEDLAILYGVTTRRLNEQVSRNISRFPVDFSFQLTKEEFKALMSQNAISKPAGRGGRRKPPRVFTEHGILMLSSVLRSERAVIVNIEIMRAFVRLRAILSSHDKLAQKLAALEQKYEAQFAVVFDAIRQLMEPPKQKRKERIGFRRLKGRR